MTNIHGDMAPRAGFLWFTHKAEMKVVKWNEKEGVFQDEPTEVIEQIRSNLKNIDKNLGAYPFEIWEKWQVLTYKITETLAQKFVPDSGIISSVLEMRGKCSSPILVKSSIIFRLV